MPMKQIDQTYRPVPWFYNWLWGAAFCWFIGAAFLLGTNPEYKGAGTGMAMLVLAVAFAPMGLLWCWKRLRTGSWL